MNELKPCPFCGGEARHYAPGHIEHHIECVECYADIKRDTEAEVIQAWNTRAERTCRRFWTGAEMLCSKCAYQLNDATANYCQSCGAKVVSE